VTPSWSSEGGNDDDDPNRGGVTSKRGALMYNTTGLTHLPAHDERLQHPQLVQCCKDDVSGANDGRFLSSCR